MNRWSLAPLLVPLLIACGPDKRQCTRSQTSFTVVLQLPGQPLPDDMVVHVMYGGTSVEEYSLNERSVDHEVVFCKPLDEKGAELDLDASLPATAYAVSCDLWTGGYTSVQVLATGIAPTEYSLLPQEDGCTVLRKIELDAADGG